MASGEMTDAEFLAFNEPWIAAVVPTLCDGGVFGTFIDWRGYPTVRSAAVKLELRPLNLVVWTKTNAGMGSLYRSRHELLPLFKNGSAPHVNNIELGKRGTLALERLELSRRFLARLRRPTRPRGPPDRQAESDARRRPAGPDGAWRDRHRPLPRLRFNSHRGGENRPGLTRRRTRSPLCRCDCPPLGAGYEHSGDSCRDRRDISGFGGSASARSGGPRNFVISRSPTGRSEVRRRCTLELDASAPSATVFGARTGGRRTSLEWRPPLEMRRPGRLHYSFRHFAG